MMRILMSDPVQPPIWTPHRSDNLYSYNITSMYMTFTGGFPDSTDVVILLVSTETSLNEVSVNESQYSHVVMKNHET